MRYILIILGLSFSFLVQAQLEDNIWLFGNSSKNGILYNYYWGNTVMDFSTNSPSVKYDSLITLDFAGTIASICDKDGSLLLYTNGMSVENSNHMGVKGADTIAYGDVWESFNIVDSPEPGQNQIIGFPSVQGAIILPFPDKENIYWILYNYISLIDNEVRTKDFMISEISFVNDISGRTNIRDSIIHSPQSKDLEFNGRLFNACQHANGRDWWIVQFSKYNNFGYIYLLDRKGIILFNTFSNPKPNDDMHSLGQYYFSPNGKKMVLSESFVDEGLNFFLKVSLFEFDRCNGNLILESVDTVSSILPRGTIAFSPSGQYFYIGTFDTLYQYDINEIIISQGRKIVGIWDGFKLKYTEFDQGVATSFGAMAHGPNGKIYSMPAGSNRYLHTVEYPDEQGVDCTVVQRKIMLNTSNHKGISNFPHFRMGPLDGSSCDTLGIDNHPVAKYRYDQDTVDYLRVRFTDISYYRPETWAWDFGDGTTFDGKKPYYHTFAQDGVYNVCLTVSNENSTHTICDTLYIGVTSTTDGAHIEVEVSLYPNPVESHLLVSIHDYLPKDGKIYFYSTSGQRVATHRVYHGWNDIDLSHLATGVYLYEIRDGVQQINAGKIMKE